MTLSLNPVAETTQALAALSELVAVPAIFTPGLLPANTTLPGASTYPRDNVTIPAIVGLSLSPVSEASATLAPLTEA